MTDERYGKVKRRFWTDDKVMQWDPDVRLLALYLMTSPHGNMLGCYFLPIDYIVSDTKISKVKIFKGLKVLEDFNYIKRDSKLNLILITNFLDHNIIENQNQVKSCIKLLQTSNIPKSTLASDLIEKLKEQNREHLQPLIEFLEQYLPKPLPQPLEEPLPEPLQEPLGDGLPQPDSILAESSINNNNNAREGNQSDDHFRDDTKKQNAIPVFKAYEDVIGLPDAFISEKIYAAIDDTSPECVCEAIKLASENNIRRWNYVEAIIRDWHKLGIKTLAQVKARELERENTKNRGKPKNKSNSNEMGVMQEGDTGGWEEFINARRQNINLDG